MLPLAIMVIEDDNDRQFVADLYARYQPALFRKALGIFNANAPDAAIGNIQTFFMLFAAAVVYNMLEKPCIPIQIRGSVVQSIRKQSPEKGGCDIWKGSW